MNIKTTALIIAGLWLATVSGISYAVSDAIYVTGTGSTMVINKLGGFDGADGADREAAFVAAAQFWADRLISRVNIEVDVEFSSSLYCTANAATLGSAGPLNSYFSSGADAIGLQNNVWYPTALINAQKGSDIFVSHSDITAVFNADLGDGDCLATSGWYYAMDGNTPAGFIDFYEVVLHELGHGLGFLSLVNSDGSNYAGLIDIFSTFLYDQSTLKSWQTMNNTERANSIRNTGNLVWAGGEVNALAGDLSSGVKSGKVQMFAPSSFQSGSSISHFDTALTPNELMEPQYTGGATAVHSAALLKDIGWSLAVPSNAVPSITGQALLSAEEDSSLTIELNDFIVVDADNRYPNDFTLNVYSGDNYSVSGSTITPALNFSGTLTVPISVYDGTQNSATYNARVLVDAVNDAPSITGQTSYQIAEDASLVMSVADLTIVDPDDSSFTLSVYAGVNYLVVGTTVYPTENYFGNLSIPVTVNDGDADSSSFIVSVTVNAINDSPVISATPSVVMEEDSSHSFDVNDFGISDVDSSVFSLEILPGDNYALIGNELKPDADFNGSLTATARVFDGVNYSANRQFLMTVNSVNDAPVITTQTNLVVDEERSLLIELSALSVVDVDDSIFSLNLGDGANYSVEGATITPAENYNGRLFIPVMVNDGDIDSATFTLIVDVNPVNDHPVISSTPSVVMDEDSSYTFDVGDFEINDVDSDAFSLAILPGDNYTLTGNRLTPEINFNGSLAVTARVFDGADYSAISLFYISVTAVNDAPAIIGQRSLNIDEDTSLILTPDDLTIVDVDTSSFALTLASGEHYTVSANTITPAAEYSGVLRVPVTVTDGTSESAVYNVVVLVNIMNDPPVISVLPSLTINEDESIELIVSDFGIVDADSTELVLQIFAGNDFSVNETVISPFDNFNGLLHVPVRVYDGLQYSTTENLTIAVNAVNDAPELVGMPADSVMYTDTYVAQFSATDIDSNAIVFSVSSNHQWLTIDGTGELTGKPNASDIGTQSVTISVSDGQAIVSQTFDLTVLDRNDTDLAVSLSADQPLTTLGEATRVLIAIENKGPAAKVSGTVNIEIAQGMVISDMDERCVFNENNSVECHFSDMSSGDEFTLAVSQASSQTNTLVALIQSTKTDEFGANDQSDLTLFFAQSIGPMVTPLLFAEATGTASAALQTGATGTEIWLANDLDRAEQRLQWAPDFNSATVTGEFSLNQDAHQVLIQDFNNDGLDDAVFATHDTNDIYLQSDGRYVLTATLTAANSHAVASADFDGDGFIDIVFGNEGGNQVYLNDQTGQFVLTQNLGSADSRGVAIVDANADGWPDLLFANSDDDDLLYLNVGLNQSLGLFLTEAVLTGSTLSNTQTVTVTSLDADGLKNDVIFGIASSTGELTMQIFSVSNNVFSVRQQIDAGDVVAVSVGDYTGNTINDIAVVNADGIVQIYSQNSGLYELIEVFQVAQASNLLLAPLNNDGKADLIVTTSGLVASQLYLSVVPEAVAQSIGDNSGHESGDVQPDTVTLSAEPQIEQTQATVIVQGGSGSSVIVILGVVLALSRRRSR